MSGAKVTDSRSQTYAERPCRFCNKPAYCKVYCSRECFKAGRLQEVRDRKQPTERACVICQTLYLSNFSRKRTCGNADCSKQYKEQYRKSLPPLKEVDPERYERNRLQHKLNGYGISLAEYEILIAENGYNCAICKGRGKSKESLHIDHNHNTGKVRGLLCKRCNTALGYFDDNPDSLNSAAEYLRQRGTKHDGPCK